MGCSCNCNCNKAIEKRVLGKSGIEVTGMGLGLWAVGGDAWGPTDDKDSLNAISTALDNGVNFFDTSDVYGKGHSEELLGQAMKGKREKFIVATKIGWVNYNGKDNCTAYDTVDKLVAGVESNLKRLNTDYIDVIQSHIFYREKTMEVFIEGFQKLQKDGKVRCYGVSTSDLEYLKIFNANGKCSVLQIDYSVLNRTPEADILPYCQKEKIGVIIRGPLAMGILTGKFNANSQFSDTDFRKNWQNDPGQKEVFLSDLEKVEKLKPLAKDRTLAQLALQFVLANPAVSTVIPGGKNEKQVIDNVSAAMLPPLTAKEMEEIGKITPACGGRKIWPA